MILFGGWGGEDLLHGRRENEIGQVADQLQVAVQRARVLHQIVLVVELYGVDENGDEHNVVLLAGTSYEREVTVVQCAHGGYQTDAFACALCGRGFFN